MARLKLRNIIGKKNDVTSFLSSLVEQLNARVYIEDEDGTLLFGNTTEHTHFQHPIHLENEILGWVKGDEKVVIITNLLTYLLEKEAEKKKLGSEILNLYQEVNLIFNFSEKLAQTIDPLAIAQTTLNEATHVIQSDNGAVIFWDKKSNQLQLLASWGGELFNEEKINKNLSLILEMVASGQSEIVSDTAVLTETGMLLQPVKSLLYAALKVKHRVMGAIILTNNKTIQYTAADLKLLTTLALQSSFAIESALLYEKNIREAKEREETMRRIYEVTEKFVPYEFIKSLSYNVITDVKLGDHVEKIVTVLFSDIRGFTTLSEQMTPEKNFDFVCSYNKLMGPIIRKHKGFINQYLGDAIMAIFPGNAADALAAAIEMQATIQDFNKERQRHHQTLIHIGIGMHTGPLIMGITGDQDRLDATTISDTVNTASRLESLTKYYKAKIIISEAALQQMNNKLEQFQFRHLGGVQLKGKQVPINIHECFSGDTAAEIKNKTASLPFFNEGMGHYLNRDFDKAHSYFKKVLENDLNDLTAAFFLNNAIHYKSNGAPENWSGVEEMHKK
jgi:adenylate cyclase